LRSTARSAASWPKASAGLEATEHAGRIRNDEERRVVTRLTGAICSQGAGCSVAGFCVTGVERRGMGDVRDGAGGLRAQAPTSIPQHPTLSTPTPDTLHAARCTLHPDPDRIRVSKCRRSKNSQTKIHGVSSPRDSRKACAGLDYPHWRISSNRRLRPRRRCAVVHDAAVKYLVSNQ